MCFGCSSLTGGNIIELEKILIDTFANGRASAKLGGKISARFGTVGKRILEDSGRVRAKESLSFPTAADGGATRCIGIRICVHDETSLGVFCSSSL